MCNEGFNKFKRCCSCKWDKLPGMHHNILYRSSFFIAKHNLSYFFHLSRVFKIYRSLNLLILSKTSQLKDKNNNHVAYHTQGMCVTQRNTSCKHNALVKKKRNMVFLIYWPSLPTTQLSRERTCGVTNNVPSNGSFCDRVTVFFGGLLTPQKRLLLFSLFCMPAQRNTV